MVRRYFIKERTGLALGKLWRISFQAPAPAVRWGQPRGRMNGAWVSPSPALGGGSAAEPGTAPREKHPNYGPLLFGQPFLLYSTTSTAPLITFFIPLSPFTTEGEGGSQQPWSKVISKALSRRWPPGGEWTATTTLFYAPDLFLPLLREMLRTDLRRISCSSENKKSFLCLPLSPPLSGWCYGELLAPGPPRFTRPPRHRFSTGAKIYEEGRVFLLQSDS